MADQDRPPNDDGTPDPPYAKFPGYEIHGVLGRGASGVVYRAFDLERRHYVAIKTLHRDESAWLHRFKAEFRSLQSISHPNLVTLYSLVSDGEVWFLTMEMVEGGDFLHYVENGPDAPPITEDARQKRRVNEQPRPLLADQLERLRACLSQLVIGVDVLHQRNILHRDIKPSNVLVSKQGRVVLLDFGLAVQLHNQNRHEESKQQLVGTAYYMSPEQSTSNAVGRPSDWYSLGVMLYEALTGRLPFTGRIVKVILTKEQREPPAPRQLVPDTPEDLNDLCVELLRRDPNKRLTGEQLLNRLGLSSDESGVGGDIFQDASLVGRGPHLASLHDALGTMCDDEATVSMMVHGRSGQGKSVLIQQFIREATERRDIVVLSGRCYERESVPFKAVDSLVDDLSDYLLCLPPTEVEKLIPADIPALARVFPVLRQVQSIGTRLTEDTVDVDQHQLRSRAFQSLRELLTRIGRKSPLVVCIDDLQWGDDDSAGLVSELLLPPDSPPLLFLGTYRSDERENSPFLSRYGRLRAQIEAPVDGRELEVGPLSADESAKLATSLLTQVRPNAVAQARNIADESGGNPFFLAELVRHVRADCGVAQWSEGRGALNLDGVLWSRVKRLRQHDARRLLEVIAIAGQPIRTTDAYGAAEVTSQDPGILTKLQTEFLVRTLGAGDNREVETYHDRVREAVAANLSSELQIDIHRRLAQVLEAGGTADPEFLAVHYDGAQLWKQAGRWYAVAADRAMEALAFDRAARLYRRAIELRAGDGDEAEFKARLGDALANAGRGEEAARAYLDATAGAPADRALELKRRAAMQYVLSGHLDDGLIALREVLRVVGMKLPATPIQALALLLLRRAHVALRGLGFKERHESEIPQDELTLVDTCWSVGMGLSVVDPIRGAEFQTRTLQRALRAGEPRRVAQTLAWEAGHISTGGGATRRQTMRLLEEADLLAQRVGHPHAQAIVSLCKGISSYLQGRWQTTLEFCDRAMVVFQEQCTGVAWELDTAQTFALWSLTYQGELAEIARRRSRCVREARARGDLYALTNFSTYVMALDRLAADQPEEGREELSEAMRRWTQRGFHVQHHNALLADTLLDLYCERGYEAWERIVRLWPSYRRSLLMRVQQVRVDVLQSRARCALAAARQHGDSARQNNDSARLLRAALKNAQRLERERMPWASAVAQLIRAGVAAGRQQNESAIQQYRRAATLLEDVNMRLFAATARRRCGELLSGDEGRELMSHAADWMTRQQVRSPQRIVNMVIPDFRREG